MVEASVDQRSSNIVPNDHPLWALLETQNSFTITPISQVCAQASLTIDRGSLKAQEHGRYRYKSNDVYCRADTAQSTQAYL